MQNEGQRRSGSRRGRKRRFQNNFPDKAIPVCPLCDQNVRDALTAIAYSETQVPAHFDCVLKKIAVDEALKPKEIVCYLGKGSFGIVHFRNTSNLSQFTVRKRIQIEPENQDISWRKGVSGKMPL